MEIWIHIDDEQQGPFAIEALPLDRIAPDTPVWHEGLPDWVYAKDVPALAHLFATQESATQESTEKEPAEKEEPADNSDIAPAPEAAPEPQQPWQPQPPRQQPYAPQAPYQQYPP